MAGIRIEEKYLEELKPYENNPRVIGKAVDKVAASIEEFGFNVPILTDGDLNIVAGHTRYKAAEKLGIRKVPVIILDGLTEEQIRQYRIVDNKTGELSSWDYEKLMMELDAIDEIDMAAFDLGGFEEAVDGGMTNLDDGKEIDIDMFADDVFEYECPECGYRWNE